MIKDSEVRIAFGSGGWIGQEKATGGKVGATVTEQQLKKIKKNWYQLSNNLAIQ